MYYYFNAVMLTLYFPMFPFDPPENIRKPKIFCFQGDQMGTLGSKGLRYFEYFFRNMQEIQLDSHVKLLDSPGIVMATGTTDTQIILRNAVKVRLFLFE